MKKTLLLFILMISLKSFSQWNISGGMTITDYSIKANNGQKIETTDKPGTGVYLKISRTAMLNDVIFLEPGFGFNTSNTIEDKGPGIKNSNIIVPIEIGAKIGNNFKVMTGVQANFSLAAKLIQQNLEVDISDNYKRTYSDLILGFSVVPAGRNIDLTFRYNLGLSNNIIGTNHTTNQTQRKDVIYIGLKIGI